MAKVCSCLLTKKVHGHKIAFSSHIVVAGIERCIEFQFGLTICMQDTQKKLLHRETMPIFLLLSNKKCYAIVSPSLITIKRQNEKKTQKHKHTHGPFSLGVLNKFTWYMYLGDPQKRRCTHAHQTVTRTRCFIISVFLHLTYLSKGK